MTDEYFGKSIRLILIGVMVLLLSCSNVPSSPPKDSITAFLKSRLDNCESPSDYERVLIIIKELGEYGTPALPLLFDKISNGFLPGSELLADTIVNIAPDTARVTSDLISIVNDSKSRGRAAAIDVLRFMGDRARTAIPSLLRVLRSRETDAIYSRTSMALGIIASKHDSETVQELINIISDRNSDARSHAAYALSFFGSSAKEALPVLISALDEPDPWVRIQAATAIGSMGKDAKSTVFKLIDGLFDEYSGSKYIWALGSIGPEASPAIPLLIRILKDDDFPIGSRSAAAMALGMIGDNPETVVPALSDALYYDRDEIEANAVNSLGLFGKNAKSALPELYKLLASENYYLRAVIAQAIWRISGNTEITLPVMIDSLALRDTGTLVIAVSTLGAMGQLAKESLPKLYGIAGSRSEDFYPVYGLYGVVGKRSVQDVAREAIAKIESKSR